MQSKSKSASAAAAVTRYERRYTEVICYGHVVGAKPMRAYVAWNFDQFRRTVCALSRMAHARGV